MTRTALVMSMVDAQTLMEHFVDLDVNVATRRQGRYPALCGAELLAASIATEGRDHCRKCIRRQVDRCS